MSFSNMNDEQIVARVQAGQTEQFGELILRYEQKMLRYARKFLFTSHDAQDHVQDIFIKAFENIQSFDTNKRFSPWLYRIAHNELINKLKKSRTFALPFFDPDTLFPHPIAPNRTDDHVHAIEIRAQLDACLNQLDIKYKEPLVLYYFEEMDYSEIADVLRIPVSTVGVRLRRGREKMKQLLGDESLTPDL